jgi:hypothetical protein
MQTFHEGTFMVTEHRIEFNKKLFEKDVKIKSAFKLQNHLFKLRIKYMQAQNCYLHGSTISPSF